MTKNVKHVRIKRIDDGLKNKLKREKDRKWQNGGGCKFYLL